ncbi:hypothetical protein N9D31_02855 [Oligoflexaceae bacterium]|nr:hypothetical protein [Oligoflexaceae bacterium]
MGSDNSEILHSIRSHANVHDRTQGELRFHFNFIHKLLPRSGFLHRKKNIHQELYFIFPYQWRITESSLPASKFLDDFVHYFRFREPYVKFSFLSPEHVDKENPYRVLIQEIEHLEQHHTRDEITRVQRMIRSYGAGYSAQLSRRIGKKVHKIEMIKALSSSERNSETERILLKNIDSIFKTIRTSYTVLRNWRRLIAELIPAADRPTHLDAVGKEFELLDEYSSALFVHELGRVYQAIVNPPKFMQKPEILKSVEDLDGTIRSHLRLEKRYQVLRNFKISRARNRISKEYALTRYRALKRHIWSVLYTEWTSKVRFEFGKHLGPAMAAGFAALWAFTANIFVILHYPEILSGNAGVKTLIGANGLFAVSVIVLAYIVKDRIKEIGRGVFGKFRTQNSDNIVHISYKNSKQDLVPICQFEEVAQYQGYSDMPIKVRDMIQRHSVELESELVDRAMALRLDRKLVFDLQGIREAQTPSASFSDIMRFNFERFQSIMGDPKKEMFLLDDEGEVVAMRMPKVYYCDVVIVTKAETSKSKEIEHHQYRRFVLDKNGLIRCDFLQ